MRRFANAMRDLAALELQNPRLRNKDILAWSTADIKPDPGETVIRLAALGVYVAVADEHDNRPKEAA